MEFTPIDRPAGNNSHQVTAEHIEGMCQRTFGPNTQVVFARELGGGTFNRAFLIMLPDQQVILRIAPPPTVELVWHERQLMRREHHIGPFFAAVAHLMPRTLMTDFTHQVIDRDYIFQS